jgi:cob(I)alamin adenosyltransferase
MELRILKEEVSRHKLSLALSEKERENFENKYNEADDELENLREINQQLETEINQWKIKFEMMEKNASSEDDQENRNLHFIEEIEIQKTLIEEKEEELQMWKIEVRKLEDELNNYYQQNRNEMTNEQLNQLEDELKQLSEENEALKQLYNDSAHKLEAYDELVSENDGLRSLLKQLKSKLEIQLETTRTIWRRAQRELELKKKIEEDIKHKVEQINRQSDSIFETVSKKFGEDLTVLKSENSRKQAELVQIQQKYQEVVSEIEIVREDNQNLMGLLNEGKEEEDEGQELNN